MVRIQSKTIKKSYKRKKDAYNYTQHLMPFPIPQNNEVTPFLKKELHFSMSVDGDTLYIALKKPKQQAEGAQNESS